MTVQSELIHVFHRAQEQITSNGLYFLPGECNTGCVTASKITVVSSPGDHSVRPLRSSSGLTHNGCQSSKIPLHSPHVLLPGYQICQQESTRDTLSPW